MKLLRNPDIVWRIEKRREQDILQALDRGEDVSGRGTVILIISGMMHQLNLVGGRIWALCDGSRNTSDVAAELAREFDAAEEEIAGDVEQFVTELIERGWLRRG